MSRTFLFPGQGSQTPDFLRSLGDHRVIQETLSEAERILDCDVLTLSTAAALASTHSLQLAIFIAGVATARALVAQGLAPEAVAGLSVGTFAASVVAGSLTFADALPIVSLRARLMQDAYPCGYGLAAIIGLSERMVRDVVASTHAGAVFVATLNSPTEITVAGEDAAIEAVLVAARAAGARRVERLALSIPSHCPLLDDVAAALGAALENTPVAAPTIAYVGNRRTRVIRDADGVREELATNVAHTVYWYDCTVLLCELGTTRFLEMPPGRVLSNLANAAFPEIPSHALAHLSVQGTSELLRREPRF